jgi:mono/diheme cytochrome c family protein
MKHRILLFCLLPLLAACAHKGTSSVDAQPTAFGSALVEVSGGKQLSSVGSPVNQPVVVQVNDDQGNAVAGARVEFSGPTGVSFDPPHGLTDSSGQLSSNVILGGMAGRYRLLASTVTKTNKKVQLQVEEIALGNQQMLGRQLDEQYCARCHNPESTPERVSNYDNLEIKPHPFTDGETLNKMSDADLVSIITHGGPGLNKSALMPPYGYTLGKAEIQALVAYIRLIADPPYRVAGTIYAKTQ